MLGKKRGRLTAIIINIFGTILTIYLLLQFNSAFYALMIILFSLSVSATQCKSKLKITTPVLLINLSLVLAGIPVTLYLFYAAAIAENMTLELLTAPVTFSIFIIISRLNIIILRNLHYPKWGNKPDNND